MIWLTVIKQLIANKLTTTLLKKKTDKFKAKNGFIWRVYNNKVVKWLLSTFLGAFK
jgi:hypothetical protein